MRKYEIITTITAEDDFIRNTNYLAFEKKAPDVAINLAKGLGKAIQSLQIVPQRHETDKTPKLACYNIRKQYYKNYIIFYLIDEENMIVYILRVLHKLVDSRTKIVNLFRD